jgi:hypothetical protein
LSLSHSPSPPDSRNKSDAALLKALETLLCSLDRYDLTQLIGEESDSTGLRVSGYLDIYLDREVIQRVLAQTAYSLITSRRDILRGIQLYELAGMSVEVLEELCNQLSLVALLSSSSSRSLRTNWKDYCETFYQKMNSETRGAAIASRLQQAGRLNLRVLFETLLNLCLFVDLHAERRSSVPLLPSSPTGGRYEEALELLDNLKLLPSRAMSDTHSSDDGFTACTQRFSRLESPVKRLMDDVIVMAMDCIFALYTAVCLSIIYLTSLSLPLPRRRRWRVARAAIAKLSRETERGVGSGVFCNCTVTVPRCSSPSWGTCRAVWFDPQRPPDACRRRRCG